DCSKTHTVSLLGPFKPVVLLFNIYTNHTRTGHKHTHTYTHTHTHTHTHTYTHTHTHTHTNITRTNSFVQTGNHTHTHSKVRRSSQNFPLCPVLFLPNTLQPSRMQTLAVWS